MVSIVLSLAQNKKKKKKKKILRISDKNKCAQIKAGQIMEGWKHMLFKNNNYISDQLYGASNGRILQTCSKILTRKKTVLVVSKEYTNYRKSCASMMDTLTNTHTHKLLVREQEPSLHSSIASSFPGSWRATRHVAVQCLHPPAW